MKLTTLIVFFLLALSVHSFAQDSINKKSFEMRTLYKPEKESQFRFYGSVWGPLSDFHNVPIGINLAWLPHHSIGIGIAATFIKADKSSGRWYPAIGLYFEPTLKSNYWVHISYPIVIGYGIGKEANSESYWGTTQSNSNGSIYVEPSIMLEFNIKKYTRIGVGFKVHAAYGFNNADNYRDISGYNVFLALKFGKFYNCRNVKTNTEKVRRKINIPINGAVWIGYTELWNSIGWTHFHEIKRGKFSDIIYGASISYSKLHWVNLGVFFSRIDDKFAAVWDYYYHGEYHDAMEKFYMEAYYGGLHIEPVLFPRLPIHFCLPVDIGHGNVAGHYYSEDVFYLPYQPYTPTYSQKHEIIKDNFWIIEPGFEYEYNITKFMRFSLGGKYRFVSNVNISPTEFPYPESVLRNWTYYFSLKFGKF